LHLISPVLYGGRFILRFAWIPCPCCLCSCVLVSTCCGFRPKPCKTMFAKHTTTCIALFVLYFNNILYKHSHPRSVMALCLPFPPKKHSPDFFYSFPSNFKCGACTQAGQNPQLSMLVSIFTHYIFLFFSSFLLSILITFCLLHLINSKDLHPYHHMLQILRIQTHLAR
jgi:hypothetical protein